MKTAIFLICFPVLPALILSVIKSNIIRGWVVRVSALLIGAASIYLAYTGLSGQTRLFSLEYPILEKLFFAGEIILSLFLLYRCKNIKAREAWIPVLIAATAAIMVWCELSGKMPHVEHALYTDNFSIIMGLIIGIIGSLICVYAISYMADYHHHHSDITDRRRSFFFILFFFLSAMFGVVFCNNIAWLFFFWEVTTMSSFILIGYPKTSEATRNAFRALGFNAIGGLGFAIAIAYQVFWSASPTIELDKIISAGADVALLTAILLSFAGVTKAAQMPFSSWLLGAMVAPTPVSAILHSSTMVKAGVFIIIKFAPLLHGTLAGFCLALVGGFTFLFTSIIAMTQSNAKRVLAYSTIANLGLIVACAGIGTKETLWAAVLLTIFHAVSKALLFLGVGTIEHKVGSRDIEDMEGLIVSRPGMAVVMLIGMLGMFLAPFGMLISKWITLEAFVQTSLILTVLVAYGSAPTLFFWTKWMGKLVSMPAGLTKARDRVNRDEWLAVVLLALGTIATAGLFPLVSRASIEPYIMSIYGATIMMGRADIIIMLFMLGMMVLIPLAFLLRRQTSEIVPAYLAGANIDNGSAAFTGSLGGRRDVTVRNFYLSELFGESRLTVVAASITIAALVCMFIAVAL